VLLAASMSSATARHFAARPSSQVFTCRCHAASSYIQRPGADRPAIVGGCLAYLVLTHLGDVNSLTVTALAGSVVAAGLVVGMLFDGSLEELLPQPRARVAQLAAGAALAGAVYTAPRALADAAGWTGGAQPEEGIAYAGLNAIGAAVLLHVAIGRRWPFAAGGDGPHDRAPGRVARHLRRPKERACLS